MRGDQILTEQFPEIEEDLTMTIDQIGTKAAADFARERRMKSLAGTLQAEL
jgi:hypothetical protein